MYLIGISGKKRSGKDTVCDLIKKTLEPRHAVKVAFADELKYEVANACGVSLNYIETYKDNFRLLLQAWGTDFRRNLTDRDYWIKKLGVKLLRLPNYTYMAIVPDVRFLNEAALIKGADGIMIRVTRPIDTDYIKDLHVSETEMDLYAGYDYVIENDSTLENLEEKVNIMMQEIRKEENVSAA